MEKMDIVTIMFGFVMFFMPMWTGTVVRLFLKRPSVKGVALASVFPFFVWRMVKGDHLLVLEKGAQMEPVWKKVLFAGIFGLFGVFLPYFLAIAEVLIADKLIAKRRT